MGLRFLFVNIGYPPFQGGAQVYVQQLAERLVQGGHRVTVYTTDAGEVEAIWNSRKQRLAVGVEEVNGVEVVRFPLHYLWPSPYGYYLARRLTVGLARLSFVGEAVLRFMAYRTPWVPELSDALRWWSEPVDVVHGFAIPFESLLWPAAECAARMDAPFFVTPFLHTGETDDPVVERSYAMPQQLALLRRASAVIALSEIERRFLLQRGVAPQRAHAVPAGIPLEGADDPPCYPPEEPPLVLFVGAVTYEKGAVHLTEAVRRLWTRGVAVRLAFIGTLTDQFQRFLDGLPAAERERVDVWGVVTDAEKQEALRRCTRLAMPSRVDSFGLVFLEAWAQGKPVIGARAGGIPAVVDHDENGLLIPFGDVDALAAAIERLLDSPEEAARLGQTGWRKLKEHYDWERVYPQLLALYQAAAPEAPAVQE